LTITTASSLPDVNTGTVSIQLNAAGGVPPYSWVLVRGSLPAGVTLSPGGLLSGTTAAGGTFDFEVVATDSVSQRASKSFSLRLVPLAITTSALPAGTATIPYSAVFEAQGSAPPFRWEVQGLPAGLSFDPATATISGAPAAPGTFTVNASVTDQSGATITRSLPLIIAPAPLGVTTESVGEGALTEPFSLTFTATGGIPPYTWSISGGDPPPGLSLSSGGNLSGTPREAGSFTFQVQVTDSRRVSASREFSLVIVLPPLSIGTPSASAGTTGQPYSLGLSANGGLPPYTWSASLPSGLSINPATGEISGTTTETGVVPVTVTATDSRGVSRTISFDVTFALPPLPPPNLTGGGTANPMTQPAVRVVITGAYPVPVTVTATLTFTPEAGRDDPAVQFSTGGRTATFIIPANSDPATFPVPELPVQTGTVAGVITITLGFEAAGANITPSPAPSQQIRINAAVPGITSTRATRTANGIQVEISGFTTTRELGQAVFRFNPAPGANLQTTDITVPVQSVFANWFSSDASIPFGGQFLFTQSFNVQGNISEIVSVTVTLSNRIGASQPATAAIQ
jgi:hypothetical protein